MTTPNATENVPNTGNEPGQQADGTQSGGTPPAQQQGGQQQRHSQEQPTVTFSPEQQALIDRLVGQARTEGRAAGKSEAEQAAETLQKQQEQEALQQQGEFRTLAEQRQARITELEEELSETDTRYRGVIAQMKVELAAAKLNVVDTEAVYVLLDKSKLTYDVNGVATNFDVVVKELLEGKPYLVQKERPQGIPSTPRPSGGQTPQDDVQQATQRKRQSATYNRF